MKDYKYDGGSVCSGDEDDYDCELDASSTGKSTTYNSFNGASSQEYDGNQAEKERFVQRETRCVFMLRVVVIFVLLCAGVAVSVIVYLITQGHQTENLQADYDAAASKVTDTFLDIALDKMGAAGSLVVAMVAHGVDHHEQWPFVTLSSFQQRSASVKQSSGALYVSVLPIVYHEDRAAWENYTQYSEYAIWYEDGLAFQKGLGQEALDEMPQVQSWDPNLEVTTGVANRIFNLVDDSSNEAFIAADEERYLPTWQTSPVSKRTLVNENSASHSETAITSLEKHAVVFDKMEYGEPGFASDEDPKTARIAWLLSHAAGKRTEYKGDIFTNVYFPIYSDFTVTRFTVGVMGIVIHWASYFRNVLPSDTIGVLFVLDNSCEEPYTYVINGEEVVLLGHGDLHDPQFDDSMRQVSFQQAETIEDGTKHGLALFNGDCPYSIRVYQTTEFQNRYYTSTPVSITTSVAVVFSFAVLLFLVYDRLVERRQRLILRKATQTHDIVASLFPKNVRDRLLEENEQGGGVGGGSIQNSKRLKRFLNDGTNKEPGANAIDEKTIADLFPNCTVIFADISGFTAWSSSRDPAQVFVLLQNLYKAFDVVARRRKVFKVETIGDSYVAVTGLPEPQAQHAVIMCRFAADCLHETTVVTRALETTLGPDTADLNIRIGLHSGPVTAGVLLGERSRFQLFGDTVNTAARMESTGVTGKIQASKATVDLLIAAGKEHWAKTRDDDVVAKGKGVLSTFWITPNAKRASSQTGSTDVGVDKSSDDSGSADGRARRGEQQGQKQGGSTLAEVDNKVDAEAVLKQSRLVDWMVQMLLEQILPIIRRRRAAGNLSKKKSEESLSTTTGQGGMMCSLDEIVQVIELPAFDHKQAAADLDKTKHDIQVDEGVKALLRDYVGVIASAYRNNPFHNFEHACHVTMNVVKFLKRIVSTEVDNEYTHGVNSDPIVVLAIVFSALVHDVDHRGISNEQLMKDEPNMAACFKHKSVAEQNSLQLAYDLLMSEQFKPIKEYIFATQQELALFRQVLVNVVLATDIFDKELNAQRKARWAKAFSEGPVAGNQHINSMRATIVMEHIIQASDVCHTMQHWHIYRKWNRRLFFELMLAKQNGRMKGNPADFWYKGEIGFFDNYVIPLAKKLEDCKVFGVSSHECLNYALGNRNEWEARGQQLVAEMLEEFAVSEWAKPAPVVVEDQQRTETVKVEEEESKAEEEESKVQEESKVEESEMEESQVEEIEMEESQVEETEVDERKAEDSEGEQRFV